nr:MAG TPA: hypothetical protein [Microviridae sp.]
MSVLFAGITTAALASAFVLIIIAIDIIKEWFK